MPDISEAVAALDNIATWQQAAAIAQLHIAGIGIGYIEDEMVRIRPLTEEEANQPRDRRRVPGEVSTRWDSQGVAAAWVFISPPPCSDVEIVCHPDNEAAIGVECTASQKVQGGKRKQYRIDFTLKESVS